MPDGKYFYIKSEMNDLVLDVRGDSRDPGTEVITWPKKEGEAANQLWYVDHSTGTIRSKMHDLCLDTSDNTLVVNEYDDDRDDQKWEVDGDLIRNRKDPDRVLDIAGANMDSSARICAWQHHGNDNQKWKCEHTEATYFYLVSKMHGKVLDVKKRKPDPGAKVVVWEKCEEPTDSQLWYEDNHGVVCNKLNDFVVDTSDGGKARLQPFTGDSDDQLWVICDDKICNQKDHNRALDIKQAATKDGAKILAFGWHGNDNQRWDIEHA